MLPSLRLAIALLLAAFIGLQVAAAWHTAEHWHEEGGAQHQCTLCLVKHQIGSTTVPPVLALVAAIFVLFKRVWSKTAELTAPVTRPLCRGPPSCI